MAWGSSSSRSASEAKSVSALDVMHRQTRPDPRLVWACSHRLWRTAAPRRVARSRGVHVRLVAGVRIDVDVVDLPVARARRGEAEGDGRRAGGDRGVEGHADAQRVGQLPGARGPGDGARARADDLAPAIHVQHLDLEGGPGPTGVAGEDPEVRVAAVDAHHGAGG